LKLVVSPPPFIKKERTTSKVLWSVVFALLPPVVAAVYLFQIPGLFVILTSVAACALTEAAVSYVSKRKMHIPMAPTLITGLILGLLLPFWTPLWIPFIGGVFAIAIAKEAFGGHGSNIFNPAIAAWVFLMVSWATDTLTPPITFYDVGSFLLNRQAERLVEASPAFVLLGGMFLFLTRLIKLDVPVGFLLGVYLPLIVLGDSLTPWFSGIFILMVFFVITDPVTSPITKRGRLIFGLGCGLMVVLYSQFANLEDGLGLAVLLMNALVPLIDRFTKPSPLLFEGMNV